MDRRAADAVFVELLREVVGAMLSAGKDQHLLPVAFADKLRQQLALTVFVNKMDVLGDLLGGRVATRHFHFQRVVQQFLSRAFDLVGEGRREQQVLPTRRQFSQYAADVMDKAHIQHAVRFIQYEDFHFIEADGVLVFGSSRRPGVATRISTPPRSFIICGLMLTPPNTTSERTFRYLL